MKNNQTNSGKSFPEIKPIRVTSEDLYFITDGLKDESLMQGLVKMATEGEGSVHVVYYEMDELKELVNSPMDNIMIQKIKRYMHLVTRNINLPGEVFRGYPIHINLATLEFRNFLMRNDNFGTNSMEFEHKTKYRIECSNFGRVKIDGNIVKPIEEKPGWLYIHFDKQRYPVYRFIAETWCLCPFIDSSGWEVHHISNDGYDNTPENLLWIKSDAHKCIGTPKEQKMKIHYDEEQNEINRIIEELNSHE